MAIDFIKTASQHIVYSASGGISSYPFTVACWFLSHSTSDNDQTVISIGESSATNDNWHRVRIRAADNILRGETKAGSQLNALGTTDPGVNNWTHCAYVVGGENDRQIYTNGEGQGISTGTKVITTLDQVVVGAVGGITGPIDILNGAVAEIGIWNSKLDAAEHAMLAAGISPLLVRPQNLVIYRQLVDLSDVDKIGGSGTQTLSGTSPVIYPHPPIIQPQPQTLFTPFRGLIGSPAFTIEPSGGFVRPPNFYSGLTGGISILTGGLG